MQPLKYSTQRDRWKQGYGACPDAWSKADSLVPSASLRCWGKSRRSGFCSGNSDAQGQQTQPDVACGAGQALVSGSAETTGRTSALCCAVVGRSGYCSGNTDGGERDVVCPAPRRLLSGGDKRKRKGESPGAAVSIETCCTVPRRERFVGVGGGGGAWLTNTTFYCGCHNQKLVRRVYSSFDNILGAAMLFFLWLGSLVSALLAPLQTHLLFNEGIQHTLELRRREVDILDEPTPPPPPRASHPRAGGNGRPAQPQVDVSRPASRTTSPGRQLNVTRPASPQRMTEPEPEPEPQAAR